MGRKKKSEKDVYTGGYISSSRSDPELLKRLYLGEFEPEPIEVTTLEDDHKRMIHTPLGSTISSSPFTSPYIIEPHTYSYGSSTIGSYETTILGKDYIDKYEKEILKEREKQLKKEVGDVKIDEIKSSKREEHIMACQNRDDLLVENILTTLSAVKAKLMFNIAAIHVQCVECSVTPKVKDNIVLASKKLKSYGKEAPIVACFDEYGKRLPDQIEIGDMSGITLKIVDPEEYGEYYYELKAIEFSATGYYTTARDWEYELPF